MVTSRTRGRASTNARKEILRQVTLDEEQICPAARGGIAEEDLIDDEVEHDAVHALINQLRGMVDTDDEKYVARFTVLCEYVLHGGDARRPRRSIGTGV